MTFASASNVFFSLFRTLETRSLTRSASPVGDNDAISDSSGNNEFFSDPLGEDVLSDLALPFKTNYGQDPRMEFEGRRRGKYKAAGKFAERMKRIQEKAKAVLGKAQEEIKKFANRRRREEEEYRVGDLVLLSTKDLKWQMKGRRSEKLTEHFVGPYKIKGIVSSNMIELELPKSIKIHPIVNISRV